MSSMEDEEYGDVQEEELANKEVLGEEEEGLVALFRGIVILSYTGATAMLFSITCK